MTYNMKSLEEFLGKYGQNYSIDIVLINKPLGDNIYKISIPEKKYNSIMSKLSNIDVIRKNIQRYYHNDKYIEIIDEKIIYKRNQIIDKLELDNFLLIARKIDVLESNSIPGLSKYDYEENYNSSVYNINDVDIHIIKNNSKYNCIIKVDNSSINNVKHVINNYIM